MRDGAARGRSFLLLSPVTFQNDFCDFCIESMLLSCLGEIAPVTSCHPTCHLLSPAVITVQIEMVECCKKHTKKPWPAPTIPIARREHVEGVAIGILQPRQETKRLMLDAPAVSLWMKDLHPFHLRQLDTSSD